MTNSKVGFWDFALKRTNHLIAVLVIALLAVGWFRIEWVREFFESVGGLLQGGLG